MVVRYVQHYSTHFIKKLEKSLVPFFRKVQKNAKNGQTWQKISILAKSAIFTKKRATLRLSPYWSLTSCQVLEKILERFLR